MNFIKPKINPLLNDIISRYNIQINIIPIYCKFSSLNPIPIFMQQFESFHRNVKIKVEDFEQIDLGDYIDHVCIRNIKYNIRVVITYLSKNRNFNDTMLYDADLEFYPSYPLTSFK